MKKAQPNLEAIYGGALSPKTKPSQVKSSATKIKTTTKSPTKPIKTTTKATTAASSKNEEKKEKTKTVETYDDIKKDLRPINISQDDYHKMLEFTVKVLQSPLYRNADHITKKKTLLEEVFKSKILHVCKEVDVLKMLRFMGKAFTLEELIIYTLLPGNIKAAIKEAYEKYEPVPIDKKLTASKAPEKKLKGVKPKSLPSQPCPTAKKVLFNKYMLSEIFSFLRTQDPMQFMQVSKLARDTVLKSTLNLWKDFSVGDYNFEKENRKIDFYFHYLPQLEYQVNSFDIFFDIDRDGKRDYLKLLKLFETVIKKFGNKLLNLSIRFSIVHNPFETPRKDPRVPKDVQENFYRRLEEAKQLQLQVDESMKEFPAENRLEELQYITPNSKPDLSFMKKLEKLKSVTFDLVTPEIGAALNELPCKFESLTVAWRHPYPNNSKHNVHTDPRLPIEFFTTFAGRNKDSLNSIILRADLFRYCPETQKALVQLNNVKTLDINFETADNFSPLEVTKKYAPTLQQLILREPNSYNQKFKFSDIFQLNFPQLESFTFINRDDISQEAKKLQQFLEAHSKTLKRLTIRTDSESTLKFALKTCTCLEELEFIIDNKFFSYKGFSLTDFLELFKDESVIPQSLKQLTIGKVGLPKEEDKYYNIAPMMQAYVDAKFKNIKITVTS